MTLVDLAIPAFHLVVQLDLVPVALAIRALMALHSRRNRGNPAQGKRTADRP